MISRFQGTDFADLFKSVILLEGITENVDNDDIFNKGVVQVCGEQMKYLSDSCTCHS